MRKQQAATSPIVRAGKFFAQWPAWAFWLLGYAVLLGCCAVLGYCWRVAFSLGAQPALPLTAGLAGVGSFLYLICFLLWRFCRRNIPLAAAVLVFCVGLLYCFVTAPLQVPDERNHYLRAAAISYGVFSYDYREDFPGEVDRFLESFPPFMNRALKYQGGQLAPAYFGQYFARQAAQSPAAAPPAPIMFMLLPFLHQGLFMAAARLLGFGALGMMYAGRMANLILYAALCYVAFRNAACWRGVFVAVAMLPLSLFMAASCSYDSMMLALCFVLVSYVFKERVGAKDLPVFALALLGATYIKLPNVLFAALPLFVPRQNWAARCKRWQYAAALLLAAVLLYLVLVPAVDGGLLKQNWPAELPRGSGTAADPGGQAAFMLRYPLRFLAAALLSIYEADGFLFGLNTLGSVDLIPPLVGGLSLLGLCAAAALGMRGAEKPRAAHIAGLVVLGAFYAAVVLAGMYIYDTDLYSIRITGQQPRYFLPVFLLWFAAAAMLLSRLVQPGANPLAARRREAMAAYAMAPVGVCGALLLFQNYFVGQWFINGDGVWQLVNCFGRQVT